MNMPKISILAGLLLCAVAIAAGIASVRQGTALFNAILPFVLGDALIAAGIFSIHLPQLRRHLMHGVAALSLGAIFIGGLPLIFAWSASAPFTRVSLISIALVGSITLGLCIHSFIAARREKRLGGTSGETVTV